jgi:hypothetical protein
MANLVPDYNHWHICPKCRHQTPLFVKEWVWLTDEERYLGDARTEQEIEYAKGIEAKLKEKNT